MNRIVSVILLFAFIGLNFSKLIILADYGLNKTAITEKYCENKDKPQMHCCGKCHLKKELAKDDEKQKSPAAPETKNDIQLFASVLPGYFIRANNRAVTIIYVYNDVHLAGTHLNVFHPPQV